MQPLALAPLRAMPWSANERRSLQRDLLAIFGPVTRSANASLCVLSQDGITLFADRAERPVTPASAQKVVIAAAALNVLGAGFRYHTRAATAGKDLWLVGSGDPVLTSNDLRGGAKVLGARGIRTLAGGVGVDASAIGGPERNPLWAADDLNYGFSAPTSAISLDQDTVEFHVKPGVPGAPAAIRLEPPNRIVTYTGVITTVPAGFYANLQIDPGTRPNSFVVSGRIAAGSEQTFWRPIAGVPSYVAQVFEAMLESRGIRTGKTPRVGIAPSDQTVVWDHASAPLQSIVAKMLFESNNHIAEQLLRTLGKTQGGIGDDAHGLSAESAYLTMLTIPRSGAHLVDASGLAVENRISALTMTALLSRVTSLPEGENFYFALPRAGLDGTLKYYPFGAARGRARIKSGHLSGVNSLAGYITTHKHGRVAFAFLVNNARANPSMIDDTLTLAIDRVAEL
ncbi:MAG: D-alanyl-D-alanine carboxypeptidase/D-alanyl-D-alanine-endopeptidase [Candidatus Eremiobacteraeota bacterium]|nr:D-alanyl-D-alanine carboxypeptidase/D-alanyl-D-alanine-endopeptidase [Candidatus Eremiobacteraeota bacterium]